MNRKIFLAGASGVIGRQLGPLLVDADYEVFGTTRSEAKVAELEGAGVKPIVIDVFDAPALSLVMATVGARHRHSPAHGSAARPRSKNDGGGHRTQRADSQRRDAESRRGGPRGERTSTNRAKHSLGLRARTATLFGKRSARI